MKYIVRITKQNHINLMKIAAVKFVQCNFNLQPNIRTGNHPREESSAGFQVFPTRPVRRSLLWFEICPDHPYLMSKTSTESINVNRYPSSQASFVWLWRELKPWPTDTILTRRVIPSADGISACSNRWPPISHDWESGFSVELDWSWSLGWINFPIGMWKM